MKKIISILIICFCMISYKGIYAQLNAVNDNFYLRVNVCPSILDLNFNDVTTVGLTKLVQLNNTLPFDNIVIDTYGVTLDYCWTGPYVKTRSFNYILFDDTSGTGIGIYDTALVTIDFANIDSIYPGDFNKDGIVNNIDLLGLGMNFLNRGLYRYGGTSSVFIEQYGQDWDTLSHFIAADLNAKYADFNGSGRADSSDLLTFYQNYALSYRTPTSITPSVSGPFLRIENTSTLDTFFDGNTLNLNIVLGSSVDTINDILGISFTIQYDSTCIAPNIGDTAVRVLYNTSNNFFITPNNYLNCSVETIRDKEIQTTIVNSNKVEDHGAGIVGNIIVVLDDYIDGNIRNPGIYNLDFKISNIVAINSAGNRLPVRAQNTTFYYKKTGTNINPVSCETFAIYPNPAESIVYLSQPCGKSVKVKIINAYGQVEDEFNMIDDSFMYSTSNLTNGFYQVLIQDEESITSKKLIINK